MGCSGWRFVRQLEQGFDGADNFSGAIMQRSRHEMQMLSALAESRKEIASLERPGHQRRRPRVAAVALVHLDRRGTLHDHFGEHDAACFKCIEGAPDITATDHILSRYAGERFAGAVPVGNATLGVHDKSRDRTASDDFRQTPFGCAMLQFGLSAFCYVLQGFDATDHLAFGIADRRSGKRQPASVLPEVGEKILGFPATGSMRRRPILPAVELFENRRKRAVDHQVGQHRTMSRVEGAPLILGAEHLRRCHAGHARQRLVPENHNMAGIHDETGHRAAVEYSRRVEQDRIDDFIPFRVVAGYRIWRSYYCTRCVGKFDYFLDVFLYISMTY